jgi:hypothetical protein
VETLTAHLDCAGPRPAASPQLACAQLLLLLLLMMVVMMALHLSVDQDQGCQQQ